MQDALKYNRAEKRRYVQTHARMLNDEQKPLFDEFTASKDGLFFLDAPGGTGKTYLLSCVVAQMRSKGEIVLCTASSGLAAILLEDGRTVHGRFKCSPKSMSEDAYCGIGAETGLAQLMRQADCIIIDEGPALDVWVFDCVDRSLRDLRKCDKPFGGVKVIVSGDWRQCLPVVPRAGRRVVQRTLKHAASCMASLQAPTHAHKHESRALQMLGNT